MEINILMAMQDCFDFLLEKQKSDPNLFFVPRRNNIHNRLEKGYFFIGTDEYMQISFWDGRDWRKRTHNIAFVIQRSGKTFIEFSAKNDPDKNKDLSSLAEYFEIKTKKIPKINENGQWFFYYENQNQFNNEKIYLQHLDYFIENEKPIIDNYIEVKEIKWLKPLNDEFNQKYVLPLKEKFPQLHCNCESKNSEEDYQSTFTEGKIKMVYTNSYERSYKNRARAINICKAKNNGKLICSVCGFSFEDIYGDIGQNFIEVHHNKPLSENNGNEVKIDPYKDLDCVCSNCHRMLHKLKVPPTIENLKRYLKNSIE